MFDLENKPKTFTFTVPQLIVGTFLFGVGWGLAESLVRSVFA